ncbi:MAG: ATP-dependent Clp protease ATP-binding subunit [Candidatus Moranbacteria bacterium]|nr:ATP-dependent Clp protease ATP-binding subunit [Candidatus Moranbacteria bacterium]PIP26004.1 MAG: ATP-dependent Clp protease ATP-binding subunit ClpC [Candidatus Moranbacteria bacterium CG23_combo_of_CG06-09_8_20_14_all_41_28]PIX91116.1 MAG: ATP-dependent Clp protease ATP-binding subunit ClpC [Candidatus Moranbacteria bacterium CG_4_10_14_3_um_filter_41_65]
MKKTLFHQRMTINAKKSLKEAEDIARYTGHTEIGIEHLLMALFLENMSLGGILLEIMGFKKEPLAKICLKRKTKTEKKTEKKPLLLSPALKDTLLQAYSTAHKFSYPYVGTEHLVYALFRSRHQSLLEIIASLQIDEKKIISTLDAHLSFDHFPQLSKMFDLPENLLTKNTTTKKSPTPFLDQYAIDMTKGSAYADDILVGREQEISRIIQILTRKQKNNPLLIGEPGVGKTALVSALAKMIKEKKVPYTLYGKNILLLDLTLVVAGTNFRGEFESRLKEILREVTQNKNIILFIDEIHTIVGAGNTSGGLDAANILKPALSRGEIQCIGATTFSEYKRHIEKDSALDRRFQSVLITEPSAEETKEILFHIRKSYEDFHTISLSKDIINTTVDLSVRYIPDRFLPDKALDIIDEASALAKQNREIPLTEKILLTLEDELVSVKKQKELFTEEEQYDEAGNWYEKEQVLTQKITTLKKQRKDMREIAITPVSIEHILKTVSHMTHIPFAKLAKENPRQKISHLHKSLDRLLIGQKEAGEALRNTLTRSLSNISDPNRPLGSFLFLGPTGVGKTLAAKILAEEFFGDPNALIRLDMSEFMERHSVSQILGAPAGYIGYGEGGKLTEQVRRKPYAVILFDEIEKAHPDVWNILLQILDEGTLTDAEGRKISFKNTLIILTSNIGTTSFTKSAHIGFSKNIGDEDLNSQFHTIKNEVLKELKEKIRPEILARLDHTIVFNALTKEAIEKIVVLEISLLKERLRKQGITLIYPVALVKYIAKKSFTTQEGARMIKKNIQENVESSIAEKLIDNPLKKTLRLSLKKDIVVCL